MASDSGDSTVENGQDGTRYKKRREKKELSKNCRTNDEYDRPKTTKYRTFSEDSKSSRREGNNMKGKVKSDVGKDSRDDEGDTECSGDIFSDEEHLREKPFSVRIARMFIVSCIVHKH